MIYEPKLNEDLLHDAGLINQDGSWNIGLIPFWVRREIWNDFANIYRAKGGRAPTRHCPTSEEAKANWRLRRFRYGEHGRRKYVKSDLQDKIDGKGRKKHINYVI